MNEKEEDINAIFDSIACSEICVNKEAYEEGYVKGKEVGEKEGYHLGYHKGAEIGSQIGYYSGFVDELIKFENKLKQLNLFEKVNPSVYKLKFLIDKFPRVNDSEVEIISLLEDCKILYKRVCAILKMKSDVPEASFISY